MSTLILHLATRARVARSSVAQSLASTLRQASERFAREQTGQDMVEYAGVLLVVAIIIAAVAFSSIGNDIQSGISSLVSTILNGSHPKGH